MLVVALVGCNSILGVHDFGAIDATMIDAPTDAGDPTAGCSQISMLADSFDSTSNLGLLWGLTNLTYTPSPMGLQLSVAGTGTWFSSAYYDLRDSSFAIAIAVQQAVGAPDISLEVDSQFEGNSAAFVRTGMMLELRRTHSGVVSAVAAIPYDAVAHRYLRFRATGSTLFYESSQDGATFAVLGTSDNDALTFVRVLMTFSAANGAFMAALADANGGTPHGAACPIDHLSDDFSGGLAKWARRSSVNGSVTIDNGAARFALEPNNMVGIAGLQSSTIYDLRGGALELEIPQMVDVTTDQGFVALVQSRASRSIFEINQQHGKLNAAIERDGSGTIDTVASVVYDPVAHRWWRIAATQDGVSWEVSPDATTWAPLAIADQLTGLDNVEVILAAQGSAAIPAGATIDNVGGH